MTNKNQIDDIDNAFIKDDEYPAKKNVEKNEEQTRKRKSVLDINTVNSILAKAPIKVTKGDINRYTGFSGSLINILSKKLFSTKISNTLFTTCIVQLQTQKNRRFSLFNVLKYLLYRYIYNRQNRLGWHFLWTLIGGRGVL